jgi:hypothetical protein
MYPFSLMRVFAVFWILCSSSVAGGWVDKFEEWYRASKSKVEEVLSSKKTTKSVPKKEVPGSVEDSGGPDQPSRSVGTTSGDEQELDSFQKDELENLKKRKPALYEQYRADSKPWKALSSTERSTKFREWLARNPEGRSFLKQNRLRSYLKQGRLKKINDPEKGKGKRHAYGKEKPEGYESWSPEKKREWRREWIESRRDFKKGKGRDKQRRVKGKGKDKRDWGKGKGKGKGKGRSKSRGRGKGKGKNRAPAEDEDDDS